MPQWLSWMPYRPELAAIKLRSMILLWIEYQGPPCMEDNHYALHTVSFSSSTKEGIQFIIIIIIIIIIQNPSTLGSHMHDHGLKLSLTLYDWVFVHVILLWDDVLVSVLLLIFPTFVLWTFTLHIIRATT